MNKHTSLTKVTENKRKRILTTRKTVFTVITDYIRNSKSPTRPDENKTEPNTCKIKEIYLDMIGQSKELKKP